MPMPRIGRKWPVTIKNIQNYIIFTFVHLNVLLLF